MIEIRKARPTDATEIRDLHVDSINRLGPTAYQAEIVAAWAAGKEPQQYVEAMNTVEHMFVAVKDSNIIGFGSVIPKIGEVRAIYVHPNQIRQGVGAALLKRLEEVALSEGLQALKLASSLNAVAFYRSCGYEQGEALKHKLQSGIEIDCVRMTKHIVNAG